MVKVKRRKKRRRSHRDEEDDEGLDEEDLDLMLENTGEGSRETKVRLRAACLLVEATDDSP